MITDKASFYRFGTGRVGRVAGSVCIVCTVGNVCTTYRRNVDPSPPWTFFSAAKKVDEESDQKDEFFTGGEILNFLSVARQYLFI